MAKLRKQEALDYHAQGKPGKIEVIPTKPYSTQRDLSLAYSPGVAEPCLAIAENKDAIYKYTAKSNLVAVISNGTAVLGLGDIGPEASKPVMEGKGLLFKIFADLDCFDIEVDATDVDKFIDTVKAISPTFGGINLEDIKAPECFEIEQRLKDELDIPIMHDDQHGTAIITTAGLLNALEIAGKNIEQVKIVVNGAGASAVSCAKLYISLGAKKENILMVDSKGVIKPSRGNLTEQKLYFANEVNASTLEEAIKGADVFLGLSKGNILSPEMVQTMAENPIVFACANPDPEIAYNVAVSSREDIIIATGRSDHPNQVNNVIGFPFIFRGAMDVNASAINEEMKIAAVKAIAALAKEPVPEEVSKAYNLKNIVFGKEYIIPKPTDQRLISIVAPAVAKAAMDSGVARKPIENWEKYKQELISRMGYDSTLMQQVTLRAKQNPQKVVFAEADNYKVLKAAQTVFDEGVCTPILLGSKENIADLIEEYQLDLEGVEIIDTRSEEAKPKRKQYGEVLYQKRNRRGVTRYEADKIMRSRNYYGSMMVETGEADALITGVTRKYKDSIRPSLQAIGVDSKIGKLAGMYLVLTKHNGPFFFADTTINQHPTAQDLADIAVLTHNAVKEFNIEPRIAMLSYSNFGSVDGRSPDRVREAVKILHQTHPDIIVDGDVQANFAVNPQLMNEQFPFSKLGDKGANTLVFPNLSSGNISYKLLQQMGDLEVIGPLLLGMNKSVHIMQLGASVREIVNMTTLAVVDAQVKQAKQV
ncbi:MAG: NADP-dependent malic enzyme [Flavobacteriales bacterium]|nr:NADP-dependent malic enzyme [Flavobacteriales bacterium]|tara:strand:- start:9040 stop:11322 length:2283 start_codon:yes stop_codon:yes gene_type:complete